MSSISTAFSMFSKKAKLSTRQIIFSVTETPLLSPRRALRREFTYMTRGFDLTPEELASLVHLPPSVRGNIRESRGAQ